MWFGCLTVVAGLVDPFVEQQLMIARYSPMLGIGKLWLALGLVGSGVAGIAVAAGWRKLDKFSAVVVLVSGLVSLAAFMWSISEVSRGWQLGYQFGGSYGRTPAKSIFAGQSGFGFIIKTIGWYAVGFCAVFAATRAFAILIDWTKASAKPSIKFSRTKVLIGLAIVLFAVKLVQDAFFPMGFLYEQRSTPFGDSSLGFGLSWIWLLGFIVFLLLPGWVLTSRVKIRWKLLLIFLVAGIGIGSVIVRSRVIQARLDSTVLHSIYVGCVLFFLATVWLASKQRSVDENQSPARRMVSIWSFIPIVMVCICAFICYSFDATTLSRSYGEDWSDARLAKSVSRYSNYRAAFVTSWGGKSVMADIDDETPDDVFSPLAGYPVGGVDIRGLRPSINVNPFINSGLVFLTNSQISSEQLQVLTAKATELRISDVEVVDATSPISIAGVLQPSFASSNDVELTSWLNSVRVPSAIVVDIRIEGRAPTIEELDAIVEFGQHVQVQINQPIFEEMVRLDYRPKLSARNLFVDVGNAPQANPIGEYENTDEYRYVMETDISIRSLNHVGGRFWDLVFAKGREYASNYNNAVPPETLANTESFHQAAGRFHWNFGSDSSGKLTEMFLPGIEPELSGNPAVLGYLKNVEVLSLDPSWLNGEHPHTRYYRKMGWSLRQQGTHLGAIERLTKLRRLDLNPWMAINDQNFLEKIPQIEHLQINFADSCRELVDFSDCPQLQTLIHVGPLPRSSVKQLRPLKFLKSVTILSSQNDMLGPIEIANLEASIPGVAVKVLPFIDFVPVPPDSFQQHVNRVAAKIRKDLSDSEIESK